MRIASARASTRSSNRSSRPSPGSHPRARSTSPAAPASSPATCAARSQASTRAVGCSQSRASAFPRLDLVQGDGLALPFADGSFDRVLSGHFYGHLDQAQRSTFLREARRVARELVLVDASRGHSDVSDQWAPRVLGDGSRWEVYKRWFTSSELLAELGGGEPLFTGDWFLVVRSR